MKDEGLEGRGGEEGEKGERGEERGEKRRGGERDGLGEEGGAPGRTPTVEASRPPGRRLILLPFPALSPRPTPRTSRTCERPRKTIG